MKTVNGFKKMKQNVRNFGESKSPQQENDRKGLKHKVLTRKMLRKNLRKMQKQKKNEYFQKRRARAEDQTCSGQDDEISSDEEVKSPRVESKQQMTVKPKVSKPNESVAAKQKKRKESLVQEQQKQRVKQLRVANKLEDKNIKKIEKQLKLHKRKSKGIPKSFVDDGLDFLLEVCDSEKRSQLSQEDFDFADPDAGFEEDLAMISSKPLEKVSKSKIKGKIKAEFSGDEDDEEEYEPSENETEEVDDELEGDIEADDSDSEADESHNSGEEEGESEISGEEEEVGSEANEEDGASESQDLDKTDDSHDNKKEDGVWEDIYGRLRDKKGNIIQQPQTSGTTVIETGKYVPPGKRSLDATNEAAVVDKLKRQMKGLLNRLAEANMPSIVSSIEEMYRSHARHSVQKVINTLIVDSLAGPILSPERLIMEHCVLIAALHANIGTEVGAQFLEAVVRRFDSRYNAIQESESKELDNLVLIVCHLYNFGIVGASLVTDILNKMAECFSEKDIELILIVLRSVGFALRKDDPLALKQVILSLQSKATTTDQMTSRVRFMLDVLLAIRNNNVAKIPNYDPSHSEHLRKVLRNSLIRKGLSVSKMNIAYADLVAAEQRGRWWVVGSAWVGQGPKTAEPEVGQPAAPEAQFSAELLELARKQRMNTDVRRNIFCILMSADDYIEASDRLMRLGLKPQQEREIVHVAVDCCLHEKQFNPYYSHLIFKLCCSHRRFKMAAQFAFWDRFQELSRLSPTSLAHLAKLVVHLVVEDGLTLAVLKVIHFAEMDRTLVRFLRHVLLALLLHPSQVAVQDAFQRIGHNSKLHVLRGGLHLFIHHFLLKNVEKMDVQDADKLRQRVQMIEPIISS